MFRWLIKRWQKRCEHKWARADILEGDHLPLQVRWCPHCGAVRLGEGEWRVPDASEEFRVLYG